MGAASTHGVHSTPPRARKAPRKAAPAWYLQGQLDNGTGGVGRGHVTLQTACVQQGGFWKM